MSELSGMTGFARQSGEADWGSWAWEAKSVNGRGLDIRINTPPGFDALERQAKAEAVKRFKRGNLQISLRIEISDGVDSTAINQDVFSALLDHLTANGPAPGSEAVATLYTVKGVVETGNANIRDLANDEKITAPLEAAAAPLMEGLAAARREEGTALARIMNALLSEMEAAVSNAAKEAGTQPARLKERLEKQLAELEADTKVDADRLAAELALAAAKADVREELDRLKAHIVSGRDYLSGGSPIGRKLDFLAQEMNREANTLCSKSISLDLTNAGLSLKGLVDQFKEQAANVE